MNPKTYNIIVNNIIINNIINIIALCRHPEMDVTDNNNLNHLLKKINREQKKFFF